MASELAFTQGSGQRIMLVDDEQDILEMLTMFLDVSGYSVEAFNASPEALARLESKPESFDLVLTDLMMPALDGVAFAEKIQQMRPDLPVLLITGQKRALERCGDLPKAIREVFLKPFDLTSLATCIARNLGH